MKKPAKKVKKVRKVKAWAVIWRFNHKIHDACNSPQVYGRTMRIFPKRNDAIKYKIKQQNVIPCTITYTI